MTSEKKLSLSYHLFPTHLFLHFDTIPDVLLLPIDEKYTQIALFTSYLFNTDLSASRLKLIEIIELHGEQEIHYTLQQGDHSSQETSLKGTNRRHEAEIF